MIDRSNEFTPEAWYRSWENQYAGDKSRFTAAMRREALEDLCNMFIGANLKIDDVYMFKGKALDFLVSENGKKRRGKHSNGQWVEQSDIDFERIVSDSFISLKQNQPKYGNEYIQYRPEIAEWIKEKFNSSNPSLIRECHRVNSQLYIEFVDDTCYIK